MTRLLIVPVLLLGLGLAACSGGDSGIGNTSSSLKIMTAINGSTISTSDSRGSINMTVSDSRNLRIIRTITTNNVTSDVVDVTANADFNFTNPAVAAMSVSGQLTALTVGFTTMEVVYRDSDGDPTDDDNVSLDITVTSP